MIGKLKSAAPVTVWKQRSTLRRYFLHLALLCLPKPTSAHYLLGYCFDMRRKLALETSTYQLTPCLETAARKCHISILQCRQAILQMMLNCMVLTWKKLIGQNKDWCLPRCLPSFYQTYFHLSLKP